jgi:uncharacterized protein YggE
MKRVAFCIFGWLLLLAPPAKAQNPEVKFIADTLVVQAEGTFEGDPDLATLTFDISAQDKELKPTYDRASASMQKIVALAEKNGLKKEDVSSGAPLSRLFTVATKSGAPSPSWCKAKSSSKFVISPASAR